MFRSVFRPYGLVWNVCNTITDVLGLTLAWFVCSLPLVTVGAATTALYDAAAHGMRAREGETYRRFLRTFKAELKTGCCVSLLWGFFFLLCFYVLSLLDVYAATDRNAALMAGGYRVLLLLPITCTVWSCVILSRFTFSFSELTVTALRYLPAHPLASLGLGVTTYAVVWFCTRYPLALTFAPACTALLWTVFAERVFQKYNAGLQQPAD